MQNRYVGDIGDYLKLGILRALSRGHRLGVAWWLYPPTRTTIEMDGISAIFRDRTAGGTSIPRYSMPPQDRSVQPVRCLGTGDRKSRAGCGLCQ
jgi:hypothetical protein